MLLAPILACMTRARIGPNVWLYRCTIVIVLLLVASLFDSMLDGGHGIRGLGGDVRRELEAWQQFGGITSIVVIALVVWKMDPLGSQRIWPIVVAPVFASLLCMIVKITVGRTRPKHGDASLILGPFGSQPVEAGGDLKLVHSWELWEKGHSELWSFPSSHTASAAAIALVLAAFYPRLRPIAWGLVAIVGFGRIATGAHFATDVVGGAVVGLLAGMLAMRLQTQFRQTNQAISL